MTVDVVTGWNPSLETVGILIATVTAFFVAVQALAVVVQALYIRGGLKQMHKASEERDRQLDQQADRLQLLHVDSRETASGVHAGS